MEQEAGQTMIQILKDEMVITIFMLFFWTVSIVIRVLLGVAYQGMIRETDNMATTNNRLLRQCKVKFANCYQLNHGVSNIPVFVDKFLNRLSVGFFSFETLYHMSGQTMLLSVVAAGIGICKSIADGRMLGEILPFYIASFIGLYLYFSVSTVVDIRGKRRALKVNLVDYLENHLSARIQVTEQDIDMLYGKGNIYAKKNIIDLVPINREHYYLEGRGRLESPGSNAAGNMQREASPEERRDRQWDSSQVTAEELEALLKDFLLV